jgi:TP901 family phage tail tape measure protein
MSVNISIGVSYNGKNIRKSFADLNKLRQQAETTSQRIGIMGAQMQLVGKSMRSVGQTMARSVTLPILAIGGAAVRSSVEFDSAFTGVIKTVSATEEQLAALRSGIREMARELPATASEIADVAAAAGQLGIATENILGFTRVMIDLGETTNLTADDAATAFARFANILQTPQTEFDRLGSTIVDLGNNLATTEAEILELGLRLAAAGGQIGLSEAQILSFAGALSSLGVEAESGGTAFSRVFVDINSAVIRGGEDLTNFANIAGLSAEEFATAFRKDAAGAIVLFIDGLGRLIEGGGDVKTALETVGLESLRVRDALSRAAGSGDLLTDALRIGTTAFEENSALAREAELRYESAGAQFEIFRNRLNDVAIELGDSLAPALLDLLKALQPIIDAVKNAATAFGEMTEQEQKALLTFVGIAAIAAPVLLFLGSMITAFAALVPLLGIAAGTLAIITGGLVLLGAAIGFIAWKNMTHDSSNAAEALRLEEAAATNAAAGYHALADEQFRLARARRADDREFERFTNQAQGLRENRQERLAAEAAAKALAEAERELGDEVDDTTDSVGAAGPVVVKLTRDMRDLLQELNETHVGSGDAGDAIAQFSRELLAAGNITDQTASAASRLAQVIRQDIDAALAKGNRRLEEARQKFEEYRDAISGGVRQGNTLSDAVSSQTTALEELTRAEEEYEEAVASKDVQRIKETDAALKAARKGQTGFLGFLQTGVNTAEGFAAQIDSLRLAGASMDVVRQIAELGARTGGRVIAELMSGGAEAIAQANRLVAAVEEASVRAGVAAADQFHSAGIRSAKQFIAAIEATIPELQVVLNSIAAMIEKALGVSVDVDISGGPKPFIPPTAGVPGVSGPKKPTRLTALPSSFARVRQDFQDFIPMMAAGGVVTSPTFAMIGEAGPEAVIPLDRMGSMGGNVINITVTSADPQAVVEALRRYTRANGPLGQVVSV